jgi:hypothetical protein
MLSKGKRTRLMAVLAVAMILSALSIYSMFTPLYYTICHKSVDTAPPDCSAYHIAPFVFFKTFEFFETYNGAITAFATVVIAGFTWTLSRATIKQGYLIQQTIDLARAEFTASHRPRLRFRYALLTQFIPGQRCVVKVCIGNVGETIALPKEMGADVFVRSPGSAAVFDAKPKDWTQYKEIPAGKELIIELRPQFPLTTKQFDNIQAGTDNLCMLMILSYADESGIERSTSIFKICVPVKRRFRKCEPDDEYAEWDYED